MNEYDTLFCFPITTLGSERQVATRCVTSHQPSRHCLGGGIPPSVFPLMTSEARTRAPMHACIHSQTRSPQIRTR